MGEINKMTPKKVKISVNPADDTRRNRNATRKLINKLQKEVKELQAAVKAILKKIK